MATSPPPQDSPKLGMKATIAGLVFVLAILSGFGVATAVSYEDNMHHDDHGDDYGDDHSEDDHDDDHSDDHEDDHAEDDHSDE